jgi:AcrR family transcriptional regulator
LLARRKERTRRELAEAATRLFIERGYDRTTIEEIAAAVDISPRTFFRYFPTKGDIVVALSLTTFEDLAGALRDRPACESLAEALCAAVEVVLTGDPAEIRAFERLLSDNPGLRAAFLQASSPHRQRFTAVLSARAGIDPCSLKARVAASAVIDAIDAALQLWGAAEDDGTAPMAAIKEAIGLLTKPLLGEQRCAPMPIVTPA